MLKNDAKPPPAAVRIMRMLLPGYLDGSELDDFEEVFRQTAETEGISRARRWYWNQVIRSGHRLLYESVRWNAILSKNYGRIAIRHLGRNKSYSFLNIFGLAAGIACFLLIMLYVQYELSYDRYHEHADRIFRVTNEDHAFMYNGTFRFAGSPPALAPTLMKDFPEVESAARLLIRSGEPVISFGDKRFHERNIFFAGEEVFTVFSLELLSGSSDTALDDPYSVILSEKAAEKYFGNRNPVGRTITLLDQQYEYDLTVTGVLKNMPPNSHFTMDFIIPISVQAIVYEHNLDGWSSISYYTYILLDEDAEPAVLESKMTGLPDKYFYSDAQMKERRQIQFTLQPLTSIHLHSHLNFEISENGDIKYIYIFSTIALLILAMACINYMNLSTARAGQRSREVGVRKVVGAHRRHLAHQFLGESLLFSGLATATAFVLAALVLPSFSSLTGRELSLRMFAGYQYAAQVIIMMLVVGLAAGGYPALLISSFRPAVVLKGSRGIYSGRPVLRNVLVVTQFVISIVLITAALIVRNQVNYMTGSDAGYNKEQIVVIHIQDSDLRKNLDAVKSEFKKNGAIVSVASSSHIPNFIDWQTIANWPGKPEETRMPIFLNFVDYDFLDIYNIGVLEGRGFSREFGADDTGAFLLNETCVRSLGWESPVGMEFNHWFPGEQITTGKIIGVLKDFNFQSLRQRIAPLYFYLDGDGSQHARYLSVKISGEDIPGTIAFLKDQMKNFSPDYPFEYSFFDDLFDMTYTSEQKTAAILRSFAFIGILVACLGLFGLASFTAEQRTKEIGIRKVLGASAPSITISLAGEFVRWVLLANVIALPAALFIMNRWLQYFAYRIELGISIPAFAAAIALLIAVLTVSVQSVRAAMLNPVNSLKYE